MPDIEKDTNLKPTPSDRDPYYIVLESLRFVAVLGAMVAHTLHPRRLSWLFGDLDWAKFGVRLFFVQYAKVKGSAIEFHRIVSLIFLFFGHFFKQGFKPSDE